MVASFRCERAAAVAQLATRLVQRRREIILRSMKLELEILRLHPRRAERERAEPVREEHARAASGRAAGGGRAHARRRAAAGRRVLCFCIDHVRQYNASYNYFDGMSDAEVEDFQKDAMTGHRPTWKVGANAWAHGTLATAMARAAGGRALDPHAFFARRAKAARDERAESRRQLKPLERKSLEALNLVGRGDQERSRPGSRNWLSATTPTPTAATRAPRTSCAKSSKPITI